MLVAVGSALGAGGLPVQATAANVLQSFGAASGVAETTLTASPASGATTDGDFLAVSITLRSSASPAATVAGVTDSGSNAWTRATPLAPTSKNDGGIWYAANAKSDSSVTVTLSTGAVAAFTVIEVTGAASTTPILDQTSLDSGSSAAPSFGITSPTSQANEIVIADIGWNGKGATNYPAATTVGYTTTAIEQSPVTSGATGEQAAWDTLASTYASATNWYAVQHTSEHAPQARRPASSRPATPGCRRPAAGSQLIVVRPERHRHQHVGRGSRG